MTSQNTVALVTGASAGIGAEFCRQLAPRCGAIIATGRRLDRLEALARELGGTVELHPVVADLASREGLTRVIEALRQKGPVDILVNNAGFGAIGEFARCDLEDQQAMVDVHISATLALCRAALPFMIERGGGGIVNLSSTASFAAHPGGMVYSASKAFLNLFSEGLQQEVAEHGVRVQSLCPGFTYSEFHDRDTMTRAGFSRDQVPQDLWMEATEVVAASLAALDAGGPVVLVTGEHNLANARSNLQAQVARLGE